MISSRAFAPRSSTRTGRPRWFPATMKKVQDETIAAMMRGDGKAEPVFRPWTAAAGRGRRDRLEKQGFVRTEEGA